MPSPGGVARLAVDKAVAVSSHEVDKFVQATRRTKPEWTPEELIRALGRSYTGLVMTTGGAAGAAAAVPTVGTAASAAAAIADVAGFTTATATYVLAVASVHGVEVDDLERRRALLLGILSGAGGTSTIQRMAGRTGAHWGKQVTSAIPMTTIRQINRVLGHNFVTKYGTKQGVIVIGKMAPFGFGAGIGAVANGAFARAMVKATHQAFGPPPEEFA